MVRHVVLGINDVETGLVVMKQGDEVTAEVTGSNVVIISGKITSE